MHGQPTQTTTFTYTPIGIIHSPYEDLSGMPIQPTGARGVRGTIDIFPEYRDGLCDLDGFSRIILIFVFHKSTEYTLVVKPFLDDTQRGVFATRAPKRPSAIGLSIVRLTGMHECTLDIEDVDILDGTPLLDIKPYVPAFDAYPDAASGWLEPVIQNAESFRSDARFRS
jgi:tRNA-Thr(GGU) m(6)t(6)A37 methyltransferase TsaA